MTVRTRRIRPLFLLVTAALVCLGTAGLARQSAQAEPPELTAPVNDFANIIDAAHEAELDSLIRKLQDASGDVMVVATVKTFKPYADIQSYATRMFENHGKGIGQKGRDNGLLIVLAVDDRTVKAEVGYELEGVITDGYAGQTSRDTMLPFFRRGDYGGGLVAGATQFAQRIAQARGVTLDGVRPQARADDDERGGRIPIVFVIFFIILFINIVRGILHAMGIGRRRGGRRWTSGVGPFGPGMGGWGGGSWGGGGWGGGGGGGFGGGFGGFGGGRSGGGGGGASW